MSSPVATIIGPEQERRFATDRGLWRGECADCDRPVNTAVEAAAVVVFVAPVDVAEKLMVVALTHERCSRSEVRTMSPEQVTAYVDSRSESGSDAMALVWSATGMPQRPVVLVSFRSQAFTSEAGGDGTDMVAQFLLRSGWELVTQVVAAPHARPETTACRFTVAGLDPAGYVRGLLELEVDGSLLTEIEEFGLPAEWLPIAQSTGTITLYFGPLHIHTWTDGFNLEAVGRALVDGALIGCSVPLALADPKAILGGAAAG